MPTSCTWRGSGSCHGQCHPGEVTLFHSPNGSTKCLRPGMQAFCCETNTWADLIKTCEWRTPDLSCPPDKPYDLTYRDVYISDCPGDSEYKASSPLYSYPKVTDVEGGVGGGKSVAALAGKNHCSVVDTIFKDVIGLAKEPAMIMSVQSKSASNTPYLLEFIMLKTARKH